MENNKINLKKFIPKIIKSGKKGNEYLSKTEEKESYFKISYTTNHNNNSKRKHTTIIPKKINRNKETFEVLGLLQAEMGKTQNGCLVFANSEYKLVNKVLNWFKKEFDISFQTWKWYVRINLQEPEDEELKEILTEEAMDYWICHSKIVQNRNHPKALCFVKDTKNEIPKNNGTLMIEYKSNLFSQIIKKYVKEISYNMPNCSKEEIQAFMRGIIAGEGCIELNKKDKKYRVFITASKPHEKNMFSECLTNLGIKNNNYPGKDLVISRKENNIQLLVQQLMTLSPKKYSKFRTMMLQYPNIRNETSYFKKQGINCHNRTPQEKIDQIIKLSKKRFSAKEISNKLGLHILKVHRVRKENNLGKRLTQTTPEQVQKIIEIHNRLPFLHSHQIGNQLNLHPI